MVTASEVCVCVCESLYYRAVYESCAAPRAAVPVVCPLEAG